MNRKPIGLSVPYRKVIEETQMLEAHYRNHWSKLIRGVRVEGETVVITVKGGSDEARCLCGEIINEMEMRKETKPKDKQ